MPFHTADGAAKRLSVDIDLLTRLAADERHTRGRRADPERTAASYMRDIPDSAGFGKRMLGSALLDHVFLVRELFSGRV